MNAPQVDRIAMAVAWIRANFPSERNPENIHRWSGHLLTERFGLTAYEASRASKLAMGRQTSSLADLRAWSAAIARTTGLGEIAYRTALALLCHANSNHRYVWPSQETVAREIGVQTTRTVRKGLASLERAGAIRSVRLFDLPPELASVALGGKSEGGSGRGKRGVAYYLAPPNEWAEMVQIGPLHIGPQRTALTEKLNAQRPLADFPSPSIGEIAPAVRSSSADIPR